MVLERAGEAGALNMDRYSLKMSDLSVDTKKSRKEIPILRSQSSRGHRIADYFLLVECGVGSENPRIAQRYPMGDYLDFPVPEEIPLFSFPNGPIQERRGPRCFPFVLTQLDGRRMYCSVLNFYCKSKSTSQALVVASRHPFFRVQGEFLKHVYYATTGAKPVSCPMERLIQNFVKDTPLPPRAPLLMRCVFGDVKVHCARPGRGQFPLLELPGYVVFKVLDLKNIMRILSAMLSESKILFVSTQSSLLTIVAETLCSLLFPFQWRYVYVPMLPEKLTDFLEAPTPFVMGMKVKPVTEELSASAMLQRSGISLESINEDSQLVLVDLDKDRVTYQDSDSIPPPLPVEEQQKLIESVRRVLHPEVQHLDAIEADTSSIPPRDFDQVRAAFLKFFTSILSDYRDFILEKKKQKSVVFQKKEYLLKKSRTERPFYKAFVRSTMFACFLEDSSARRAFDAALDNGSQGQHPASPLVQLRDYHHLDSTMGSSSPTGVDSSFVLGPQPVMKGLKGDTWTYSSFPTLDPNLFHDQPDVFDLSSSTSTTQSEVNSAGNCESLFIPDASCIHTEDDQEDARDPNEKAAMASHIFKQLLSDKTLDGNQTGLLVTWVDDQQVCSMFCNSLIDVAKSGERLLLSDNCFHQLVALVRAFCSGSDSSMFRCGRAILKVSSTICRLTNGVEEPIQNHIQTLALWQNMAFWNDCFLDAVAIERRKLFGRKMLEEEVARPLCANVPEPHVDRKRQEDEITFNKIVLFAFTMLNMGIDKKRIEEFAKSQCSYHSVADDLQKVGQDTPKEVDVEVDDRRVPQISHAV